MEPTKEEAQFIKKLLLNSTYGCLGNEFFKFFDIRMAMSTTRSGREALMHMIRTIASLLDGKPYEWISAQSIDADFVFPSESIIYGDTEHELCYDYYLSLVEFYDLFSYDWGKINSWFLDTIIYLNAKGLYTFDKTKNCWAANS